MIRYKGLIQRPLDCLEIFDRSYSVPNGTDRFHESFVFSIFSPYGTFVLSRPYHHYIPSGTKYGYPHLRTEPQSRAVRYEI